VLVQDEEATTRCKASTHELSSWDSDKRGERQLCKLHIGADALITSVAQIQQYFGPHLEML